MTAEKDPREHYLAIHGLRLRYLEQGPVRARPVVLLHGTGDNIHTWDLITPHLAPHFRVVALDQRGHGKAAGPFRRPTGAAIICLIWRPSSIRLAWKT